MSGRIFTPTLVKVVLVLSVPFLLSVSLHGNTPQGGQSQDQPSSDAQSQSIAEAARRSREQTKNTTKPSKVITDDDLDKNNVKPGAQGLTVDAPAKLETNRPRRKRWPPQQPRLHPTLTLQPRQHLRMILKLLT
jgi:hypothetical protein